MGSEFGRRRPAEKQSAAPAPVQAPAATAATEEQGGIAEFIYSTMLGPVGGVVIGFIVVCVIASVYISNMRSMGRELDQSWAKKTIGPVENSWGRRSVSPFEADEPDLAKLANRPCEVRSLSPSFREVQRQLGC